MSFAIKGWQCPICGGVYSPTTPQCFNCTGRTYSTSSTETTQDYLNHLNKLHVGKECDCTQCQPGWPIKYVSKEELKEQFPDKPNDKN